MIPAANRAAGEASVRHIAHELNNQLVVMTAQSELLLDKLDEPRLRERVEQIQTAARESAVLTRQLLELGRAAEAVAPAPTPAAPPRASNGKERILLLDDQAAVRDLAAEMLRREGYDVVVANDPEDAVARVQQEPASFDLLVTDVVMPTMTGSEVAERVGEISPLTKVLYISGYAPQLVREGAAVTDGPAYLEKPFTSSILVEKVRGVLARPGPVAR